MTLTAAFYLVVPVSLFILLTACSGETGREITITANEFQDGRMSFEPSQIFVQPGETVTLVLKNEGGADHELESNEARISEVVAPPGKIRRVTWHAPDSGTFPVYCDLPGHREAGMELTLVVE